MTTYERSSPVACPWCGAANECFTETNSQGKAPEEGDISLCFVCYKPGVHTATGNIRRPNDQEYAEIMSAPEVKRVLGPMMESIYVEDALALLNPPKMPVEFND